MAAKTQQVPQDNTGSSVLSQTSPLIDLSTSVLASVLSLPEHPLIVYSVFTYLPATASDPLDQLELARRSILTRNQGKSLLESLLPCVHVSKDTSTLYVFAFGSAVRTCDGHHELLKLEFESMHLTESSSFAPAAIYPCSEGCASQVKPCDRCLDNVASPGVSQPAQLLPRVPLRLPLTLFLQSVRDRLIDDVGEASKTHPHGRFVTRLKGGFLLGPVPFSSDWGSGWENHAHSRPLIFCNLHVHLSYSSDNPSVAQLVVHPVMRPTYYLPLRLSLPVAAGTPVVLLPHGIPAYYLSTYGGPSAALTAQFEEALLGLGAGDWKREIRTRAFDPVPLFQDSLRYVVVWLTVQNKKGEDKGMPVIWPITLCASYHVNSPSAHARSSLPYIPDLPAQLQASPPPPAPAVPTSLSFGNATSPISESPTVVTISPSLIAQASGERDRLISSFHRRPTLLRSSTTSDSLRAFSTLSLSRKPYTRDIKKMASEVGGYVDSVVKERERARERIRQEAARAKLAEANPPPALESPAPSSLPEVSIAQAPQEEEEENVAVESPPVHATVEPEEHESVHSPESEHSGDSLFSPADATIDLPSTEEEPQTADENPPESAPAPDVQAPPPQAEVETTASTMAFDPFHGFDGSWPEMNMEYDLGFGMDIDSIGGARTGGGGTGGFDMDDGLPFTDDDFDFFNAPQAQHGGATMLPPVLPLASSLNPFTGGTPLGLAPLMPVDTTLSGPGPPSAGAGLPSPWQTQLGDPFTPTPRASVDMHNAMDGVLPPPDLLPPSPTRTPSSYSAPATPSVHLADSAFSRHTDGRRQNDLLPAPNIFDPIPFASSHREADGKYTVGKFALPSPPAEKDVVEPMSLPTAGFSLLPGWKHQYTAVTDYRVGVIRKLIGVKRKSLDQGVRAPRKAPVWESYREPEEWQSSSPPPAEPDSSSESEEEPWPEEDDVVAVVAAPRPATPPPSYLPLGPTLLRSHFHHAHLLPMCTPLRPPGMAVSNTPGSAVPISVPTPVSPAAILGAASEKSKSLEAAAQILVKEVVENPVWSEAWRANASLSPNPPVLPVRVWQADARCIKHLVGTSDLAGGLRSLFSGGSEDTNAVSLRQLDSPMLVVGKGDSVIQLSPTSLRFWEKLGLSPRAGPKDVKAFVFFEGAGEERENDIENWLQRVSAAYSAKNLGTHTAGISTYCAKPGLAPIHFETLRKTLTSFGPTIPPHQPHVVFYIVTPSHIVSSSSTTLRQILSAVRRFYKAHPEGDILIHFVPETLIFGTYTHPASNLGGLDTFVCSVYDRLLQPVSRAMSRKFFNLSAPIVSYLEAPAYALIPAGGSPRNAAVHPRVTYALESSASTLDVVHRHMLLHIGYQVSTCGRWILAAAVDAEGEAHELKAWLTPDNDVEQFLVSQVWTFGLELARRANIEWRVVISKLGLMGYSELNAWVSHLESVVAASSEVPPMHVTLLSIDTDSPWTFLSPRESGSLDILKRPLTSAPQVSTSKSSRHTQTTFSDATCTTYFLSPSSNVKLYPDYSIDRPNKCAHPPTIPGSSELPFIPDLEDDEPSHPTPHSLSTETLKVPDWCMIICASSAADHTSLSTLRIFQLHVTRSLRSTYGSVRSTDTQSDVDGNAELMGDIVRNFHDLAVLSRTRWKLGVDPALPFHLAALEVMRTALSGGAVEV